jgi:rhomboid protease GluP
MERSETPGEEPRRARLPGWQLFRSGPAPATLVAWIIAGLNVAIWLAMELAGGSASGRTLVAFGAKVNPLIADGQYWRLLTSVFLHIGFAHLLFNSVALLSFGRVAEMVYGHTRFLAIYLVSGITGSVLSYLLSRSLSAGASGAIFGVAGALAVFFALNRGTPIAGQGQLGGIVFVLIVNGVLGITQAGVDNWGHAGGLLGGLSLATWLAPRLTSLTGAGGEIAGIRWERSSAASWVVVPAVLAILAAAVAMIPPK